MKTWAEAGQGKTDITALKNSPSLVYQAVLVAAYTKDKTALSQLAKDYDFTKTPTPVSRLEDIALIFAHFGEKEEAKVSTLLCKILPSLGVPQSMMKSFQKLIQKNLILSPSNWVTLKSD